MNIESAIVSVLRADAAVAAIVAQRIRPISGIQGEARPFVAYSVTNDEDPSPTHQGPSQFRCTTFDLVCVADTYESCRALSAAVHARMKLYTGTVGTTRIIWTKYDDQTDIEQANVPGTEKPTYVRSQTYRAMHRPV